MRFSQVNLQYFRNTHFLEIPFQGTFQFFCGPNGQGKTNILEALAYPTNLRSFRGVDNKCLINENYPQARVFYQIQHEMEGDCELLITLNNSGTRTVELNNTKITKVSQIIGLFPIVVLSSEDIQWLRGAPLYRRKFLDLSLASTDPAYLQTLSQFHQILQERNVLLKTHKSQDHALLNTYNTLLSPLAFQLYQKRVSLVNTLSTLLLEFYQKITQQDHAPEITFNPNVQLESPQDYLKILEKSHERDFFLKSTQKGPHRDDFTFKHSQKSAKLYASEGQQRALVIALRLAQITFLQQQLSINPIVLADDVLGQLDPEKYQNFWSTFPSNLQLIASGTTPPQPPTHLPCQIFNIHQGQFLLHI